MKNIVYDQALDFCKFKIPLNGGRVIWEITNECNYGCSYCIFSSTGRKPAGELSTQKVFSVIEQLSQAGFNYIKLTGGEPFLRHDMLCILKKINEMQMNWDISTNASRITKEIALNLSVLSPQFIHVSLDGHTQEIHESVRGKKSFYPTIKGLELLAESGLNVRVGCVLHLNNQDKIHEMIDWTKKIGAHELVFSVMENVGRLRGKKDGLITRSLEDLISDIQSYKDLDNLKVNHNLQSNVSGKEQVIQINPQNNSICPGGSRFLFINSIGQVSPCPWISEKMPEYIVPSLHEKSLKEILQGQRFSDFIKNAAVFNKGYGPSCPAENLEKMKEMIK